MKLAEALRLKADLGIQIAQMLDRVKKEAIVEESAEDSTEVYSLIQSFDTTSKKLLRLNVAINEANMKNTLTYVSYYDNINNILAIGDAGTYAVPDKVTTSTKTVMEALAERERLTSDIQKYKSFLSHSEVSPRYNVDDIKKKSALDRAKLRKRIDAMAKYLRLTDTRIQENNWLVELEFEY